MFCINSILFIFVREFIRMIQFIVDATLFDPCVQKVLVLFLCLGCAVAGDLKKRDGND